MASPSGGNFWPRIPLDTVLAQVFITQIFCYVPAYYAEDHAQVKSGTKAYEAAEPAAEYSQNGGPDRLHQKLHYSASGSKASTSIIFLIFLFCSSIPLTKCSI